MATTINFPDSPTQGQQYTYGNVTYEYNGTTWKAIGGGGGSGSAVKSDWEATSGDAEILNKPTVPSYSTGVKTTGVDAGELYDVSTTDDYMYVCVLGGIAGVAIWKKIILYQT